ncbi:MAG: GntR family transcriptional regulator, partial [Anaerolineae bacterium]|nr:GntR family transcriptional regulator [Anaerolineae bacterium]
MKIRKLQGDTLASRVSRELKRLILDGEATPGELLPPQREIAQRLSVGLSTLREA